MASNLPEKPAPPSGRSLDRAALERVLARASELQAGTSDISESMTEDQLIELGKEVGLSPEHVRQAIAEEQTRVAIQDPGRAAGFFGPGTAWTQRVIAGKQADILARIDRYMQKEEGLTIRRRFAERITWEASRDFLGTVRRGFRIGGGRYALTKADEVGATVVPVDESRVLVRLDAAFTDARRRNVTIGGTLGGVGLAGGGGLVAVAASFPGASMPIAVAIGSVWAALGGVGFAAMARTQRSSVQNAQLALEQALDRLEHGEPTRNPSIFEVITSVINR